MRQRVVWGMAILFFATHHAVGQNFTSTVAPTVPKGAGSSFVLVGEKKEEVLTEPGPTVVFDNTSRPRSYVGVDYLLWWIHRGPTPVLLTTAADNGVNQNGLTGGILGEPGTTPVFTATQLDYHVLQGIRAYVGCNLGDDRFWGVEIGGFYLRRGTIEFTRAGSGNGTPLLTIPFFDAATGRASSLDISSQDSSRVPYLNGRITIRSEIQVWGVEANFIAHSIQTAERDFDMMFGFRAMTLNEDLTINQRITPLQSGAATIQFPKVGQGVANYYNVPAGGLITVYDAFSTRNQFYGPQVGGRFLWNYGEFTTSLTGKVAVGVTHQQAIIDGLSTATSGSDSRSVVRQNLSTPGGVFAAQNNIGSYSQNQFTVIPEIELGVNWAITRWLNFRAGYTALYWSNVARPGAQIDPVLNSKLVPTGALLPTNVNGTPTGSFIQGQEQGRPYFNFNDTSFWAHGVNFGIEIRY